VIFVFSLLGVSHNSKSINIDQLRSNFASWVFDLFLQRGNQSQFLAFCTKVWEDGSVVSVTGKNFWLVGVTLAESALASLEYNWLWSGKMY